ncbi:hypothetical protein Ahy_A10g050968 [Arachis hypogaea]|uniref:Uncharacterized protein n=1 Tax=Arachis hypogaea TaxID=3818 RepID=A0A445BB35_ARAHY|nr:hypothetical protein Ahy_A10g050968 [Arachis hypogaea]
MPKGVADGQQVNIPVLPLVGPEGRRRLVLTRTNPFLLRPQPAPPHRSRQLALQFRSCHHHHKRVAPLLCSAIRGSAVRLFSP